MKNKKNKALGLPREAMAKWGQHFLRDPKILKKIADFARIEPNDVVVEVGPGEGGLTKILLEKAARVVAVEKDEKLAERLKERFSEEILDNRLEIIIGDVLNYELRIKNYALVGNIPYYITGVLFKKFLESENQPKSITFVIQKEVADRIMAKDGKESILSISIKAYGRPEFGGIIKAGSFYPKPKVDSGIISIRNISKKRFLRSDLKFPGSKGRTLGISESKFFEILRKGFSHKRKLLARNLGDMSRSVLDTCGIPEKARAENLGVDNWICLTKNLLPSSKFWHKN